MTKSEFTMIGLEKSAGTFAPIKHLKQRWGESTKLEKAVLGGYLASAGLLGHGFYDRYTKGEVNRAGLSKKEMLGTGLMVTSSLAHLMS